MAARSKFFDESSDSSSDEQSIADEKIPKIAAFKQHHRYDDDDETEQKRIVRTEKDKRYEDFHAVIRNIANAKKIHDFGRLFDAFESLTKVYMKAKKVIEVEGIPNFFIVTVAQLQDFIDECWEKDDGVWRKNLEKGSAKYLAILRQRIRKYNRDFEEQIKSYHEDPTSFESYDKGQSDEEDKGSEKMEIGKPVKTEPQKETKVVRFIEGDVDGDSDESPSDWDSTEESSDYSLDEGGEEKDSYTFFLKSEYTTAKEDDTAEEKKRQRIKKKQRKTEFGDDRGPDEEDGWEEVREGTGIAQMVEKPKMFGKDEDVTHEAVVEKANEIMLSRGKRGFDPKERCELFTELRQISATQGLGVGLDLYLLFEMIGLTLDRNRRTAAGELHCDWHNALSFTKEAVDVVIANPQIIIAPELPDDKIELKTGPVYRIRGCVLTSLSMLTNELTRIYQTTDAHTSEYVDRLRDGIKLRTMIETMRKHMEQQGIGGQELCRIYYMSLEHRYFKLETPETLDKSLREIDFLAQHIYVNCSDHKLRVGALLMQAYHLATYDYWYRAKDILLMPLLQDNIWSSDIPTQIMYNRAVVQLGMCAFRRGLIKEAHSALTDVHSNNRSRELLAQGIAQGRNVEKTPEQEKNERQRLMPYHLHINLEVLEALYLITAMLLEVSHMESPDFDIRKRTVSKQFYHQLKQGERQPLYGPPDNMREHILAAVKEMRYSDWKNAKNILMSSKMKTKVWQYIRNREQVQNMVVEKLKEECLKIYLFCFTAVFDNINIPTLAKMFELPEKHIKCIVSRMIIKKELMASLDQPSRCIVMHRTTPSAIQRLNLQLAEKVGQLVEANDKMSSAVQMRSGGMDGNITSGGGRRPAMHSHAATMGRQ